MAKKYSNLKIAWYPDKLKALARGEVTPPIFVRLKPTNRCVHNCFYCSYHFEYTHMHETMRREDELPKQKIMETLSDLNKMGVKSVIYSGGGEPLFHPDIEEILQKTLDYKLHLAIITNGQLLNGKVAKILSNADWVRISLDYHNEKLFKEIRGVDTSLFHILKNNIKNFSKIKKPTCNLSVNCVVHEKNKDCIYKIAKFCKNLGVETIRISPVWNPNFVNYHRPFKNKVKKQLEKIKNELCNGDFEMYETYSSDLSSGASIKRKYKKCYWMQINPVIAADSNIYTCHNKAYDKTGLLGSIKNQSFKKLWFSKELAKKFKNFDAIKNCHHQCSSESRNMIIADILNCESTSNFI